MSSECAKCGKIAYDLERISALGKNFHKSCFRCKHCDSVISLKGFAAIDGEPYCKPHYLELFKSKGNYGGITGKSSGSSGYNSSAGFKGMTQVLSSVTTAKPNEVLKKTETVDKSAPVIEPTVVIKKVDRAPLLDEVKADHELKPVETVDKSAPVIEPTTHIKIVDRVGFLNSIKKGPDTPLEKPTAVTDRSTPGVVRINAAQNPKCARCEQNVYPMDKLVACDKTYHKGCFKCKHCDGSLSLKGFATIDGEPYCKPHYLALFKTKGNYSAISGTGDEKKSSSFNVQFKGY
eukprot:TRINITY_DN8486_c0_g1_i1.p1 TRINITY_DN8486_c0_g1~~TRINITY_DN8486_c0_g1_i1.p1  ORF type:complete len:291 (-),score=44.43 TRINITY_DN8486_c0_g1_i1:78-950(-)